MAGQMTPNTETRAAVLRWGKSARPHPGSDGRVTPYRELMINSHTLIFSHEFISPILESCSLLFGRETKCGIFNSIPTRLQPFFWCPFVWPVDSASQCIWYWYLIHISGRSAFWIFIHSLMYILKRTKSRAGRSYSFLYSGVYIVST